jgi:hypothetical protein
MGANVLNEGIIALPDRIPNAADQQVRRCFCLWVQEVEMKLTLLGALAGAVMLALGAPAGAATVTGTSAVNSGGSVAGGDPALNFGVTNFGNGAQGIDGAFFTNGKHYFDYIFSFSLTGPADVSVSASADSSTNILDYHAALFSSSPASSNLLIGSNPGPLVDLTNTTDLLAAGSTSGNNSTNTLNALNLATGTYYLRLFGVTAGVSANSILTALSGSFTAVAVAATPIPAALPLFVSAMGLFGFMGWRRKAAMSAVAA